MPQPAPPPIPYQSQKVQELRTPNLAYQHLNASTPTPHQPHPAALRPKVF
ncbi:hypothetical protein C8J56DRAFT_1042665 [Mycena floridula]|nr:hypothetical protein C8J56DRAFT_1042665 [Mycena floridula]